MGKKNLYSFFLEQVVFAVKTLKNSTLISSKWRNVVLLKDPLHLGKIYDVDANQIVYNLARLEKSIQMQLVVASIKGELYEITESSNLTAGANFLPSLNESLAKIGLPLVEVRSLQLKCAVKSGLALILPNGI